MKVPQPSSADSPGSGWFKGLDSGQRKRLQRALLSWFRPRARPLRIRNTSDAWAILVAEVMAQQTQISRVDDAWVDFMQRFPTPSVLAAASGAEVLRAWAGLGYNKRALALQRAARAIEAEHRGRVPSDIDVLQTLPGVGPYTARAVAAVAYGQPVAAVDTNVRRVVTRLVGTDLSSADLQATADRLVTPDDPARWTHASMDLGATVCRSRRPLCEQCPLRPWCQSAGRVPDPVPRSASGQPAIPFERTTRWLRGQIVARLREIDEGAWTQLPSAIGEHEPDAVTTSVMALERDGLLERRSDGAVRLPSTVT